MSECCIAAGKVFHIKTRASPSVHIAYTRAFCTKKNQEIRHCYCEHPFKQLEQQKSQVSYPSHIHSPQGRTECNGWSVLCVRCVTPHAPLVKSHEELRAHLISVLVP